MSNAYIPVPGSSPEIDLQSFRNNIAGKNVDAEAVVIVDVNGNPLTSYPVQGVDAAGVVATGKPVQVGGVDVNGKVQPLSLDASANLKAVLGTSGAVIGHVVVDSGSITANAGNGLNTSALALESGGNLAGIKTDLDKFTFDGSGNVKSTLSTSGAQIGAVIPIPASNQPGLLVAFTATLSTTVNAIKNASGRLYGYNFFNPGSALTYVQIFNVAAASVTLGVTTPFMSIGLPSTTNGSVGVDVNFTLPVAFSTAMSYAATTTPTGSTAPATAIVANLYYN